MAFNEHVDSIVEKMNSRMFCLRKLNSFHVNRKILATFYDNVVASVWPLVDTAYGDLLAGKLTMLLNDAYHPLHDALASQLIPRSGRTCECHIL